MAVWKTFEEERDAVCLLSMKSPVSSLDTAPLGTVSAFAVLAVTTEGAVHVWKCTETKNAQFQATQWARIEIKKEQKE